MIAIANPIKEEYNPVQNTSDIDIDILSQDIICNLFHQRTLPIFEPFSSTEFHIYPRTI
jgi:hypothetical protein